MADRPNVKDLHTVVLGTMRPYGLGVDCHSRFCVAILNVPNRATGHVTAHEIDFEVTIGAIEDAKKRIQAILRAAGIGAEPLSYVLESTATYHLPVVRTWKGNACIINPALAAQFKARKTDRWDAGVMSVQHMQGMWAVSFLPDEDTEMLRCLMRHRRKSQTHATRCYSQITLRLSQWYNPLKDKSSRDPALRAAIEDFAAGKTPNVTDIPELVNSHLVPKRIWRLLADLYSEATAAEAAKNRHEKEAMSIAKAHASWSYLMTVPGVGKITAATWVAEVDPVSRFLKVNRLVAYTGFDPTQRISAGKVVAVKARKGNKYVHATVVQAAQTVLRDMSCPISRWALKKKGKRHKNLLVQLVGREIVEAMYHVSTKKTEWVPTGKLLDFVQPDAVVTGPADEADGRGTAARADGSASRTERKDV